MHAMPTMATSTRPCAPAARRRDGRALERAAPSRPRDTSRCSSAIVQRALAERGDLADHEHALAALLGLVDGDEPIALAPQALGGDAQPSEVELLERLPHLLPRSCPPPRAARARPRRRARTRCRRSGWRGPGAVSSRTVLLAARSPRPGSPGTMAPVATASSVKRYAVPISTPTFAPRAASGAAIALTIAAERASWMPPAKRTLTLARASSNASSRSIADSHRTKLDRGPDVAAALAPLEDEAARAVLEEQVEQARRRDVQVRRDARVLERARLRGAAAGDERDGGRDLEDERELLVADLRRHEAEDADAPRRARRARARVSLEDAPRLVAAHEREREERQAARVATRRRRSGAIAHARHRALGDGVPRCRAAPRASTSGRAARARAPGARGRRSPRGARRTSAAAVASFSARGARTPRPGLPGSGILTGLRRANVHARAARRRASRFRPSRDGALHSAWRRRLLEERELRVERPRRARPRRCTPPPCEARCRPAPRPAPRTSRRGCAGEG